MKFPGVLKKYECSVFIFGLGIFKGCNTISRNSQEQIFVVSKISKGKETNLKISGFPFFKKVCPQTSQPAITCSKLTGKCRLDSLFDFLLE